jgi:hypothetical protein
MTTQTIQIEFRSVYGRAHYYVVSEHARAIAALTGRKTVDRRDIEALTALGFSCVMVSSYAGMPAVEVIL